MQETANANVRCPYEHVMQRHLLNHVFEFIMGTTRLGGSWAARYTLSVLVDAAYHWSISLLLMNEIGERVRH